MTDIIKRLRKIGVSYAQASTAQHNQLEAADEIERLRAELDNIKQVEFQRRVEKVAEGWRGKCDRLEKECDALRAELDALKAWKAEVEAQKPVGYWDPCDDIYFLPGFLLPHSEAKMEPRYARPIPAQSVPKQGAVEMNELTQAALDVLAERRRQIEAEGWAPEYDDKHSAGEMAKAAACYALVSAGFNPDATITVWPWHRRWWKPRDKRCNLVKAAALTLAEIERLDRMATAKPEVK